MAKRVVSPVLSRTVALLAVGPRLSLVLSLPFWSGAQLLGLA